MSIIHDKNYSYTNLWRIAFPIIIGSAAQDLLLLVDTAFMGHLGAIPLGAAAIGGLFYLALVMAGWGFGIGIQVLVARRFGQGQMRQIEQIIMHSFIIMFVFALCFILLGHFISVYFLDRFIASKAIADQSRIFIQTRIWGFFAAFANIVFRAYFVGTANTRIISISTIIMASVNCLLAYLFIFGIGPFPAMAIKGSALASVISEYLGLFSFIYYFGVNNKRFSHLKLSRLKISIKGFTSIINVSSPMLLQSALSFVAWFVFFIFVEKMGEIPLAVSNIVRSIYIIMLIPIMGIAAAANSLTSFAIGKNQPRAIRYIAQRSILMAGTAISLIVIPVFIFAKQVISIYTNSPELIQATEPALRIVMLASFCIAFGIIMFQMLAGTGNTHISLIIESLVIFVYLLLVYLLSYYHASITTIWSVEIFYGLALGVISLLFFKFKGTAGKLI